MEVGFTIDPPEASTEALGIKHSSKTLEKMSASARGRVFSKITREKISKSVKKNWRATDKMREAARQNITGFNKTNSYWRGRSRGKEFSDRLKTIKAKTCVLTSPEGVRLEVSGVKAFVAELNKRSSQKYSPSGFHQLCRGVCTVYKGWTGYYL